MQNQELIEYCNNFNQGSDQYKESIQSINFLGTDTDKNQLKELLKDLNIVVIDGE